MSVHLLGPNIGQFFPEPRKVRKHRGLPQREFFVEVRVRLLSVNYREEFVALPLSHVGFAYQAQGPFFET